jgi:peptide/nickel transport system substrate-binding protein
MASRLTGRKITRRTVLLSLGVLAAMPLLEACQPGVPASKPAETKPAESKPAEAPKPAAPAATTAPAAPAAAKPTEVAKPAAVVQPTLAPTVVPIGAAKTAAVTAQRPPEPNPKRGGILRMAAGGTTPHFDVYQGASTHLFLHLYSNLVQWNLGDGLRTIVPDLAEKWEVSADGLTYTFNLRDGVKFHDGTPFTSADVAATFNRAVNPPSGVVILNRELFSVIDKIETPDPLTAIFKLKEPRSYMLLLFADPASVIYPKKTLDENNGDLRKVIAPGTGAFVFKEHKTGEVIIHERNPNYYDKELPYIDRLEWYHVAAWTDRGTAVLTNQADISWNVSFETYDEGSKRKGQIEVNKLPNFGAYAVLLNTKKKPLDDPKVRQAIHLAASRPDLIKAFQTQEWINLTRWIPFGDPFATPGEEIAKMPGYRQDKNEDIAAAKKLLADAGYGSGMPPIELLSGSLAPHAEVLAPAFQDQLKRTLGIETKIRVVERTQLIEEEKNGNFEMVLDTPGHLLSDISPLANSYWKTGGSRNFGGYSNPDFDAKLKAYDVETNEQKRRELATEMQNMLDENPPWYLIGFTFHLPMWQSYVKGLALDNRSFAQWGHLDTVWLDK